MNGSEQVFARVFRSGRVKGPGLSLLFDQYADLRFCHGGSRLEPSRARSCPLVPGSSCQQLRRSGTADLSPM